MSGICEHGYEHSGSIKCGEFLDYLKTGQLPPSTFPVIASPLQRYYDQTFAVITAHSSKIFRKKIHVRMSKVHLSRHIAAQCLIRQLEVFQEFLIMFNLFISWKVSCYKAGYHFTPSY